MTTISLRQTAAAAVRGTAGRRFAKLLVRIVMWPARVARARRDLAQLAAMSDHELADIGLGRHDLRDAAAQPLDGDPTAALAAASKARHRRQPQV